MPPDPLHHRARLIENSPLCRDHFRLVLENPLLAETTRPGQFINLRVPGREDLLLRRPFSVALCHPDAGSFEIVYRVVGKGTLEMSRLLPGAELDLLGPLGKGFTLPVSAGASLLVGAGCGVAPLWGLAEALFRESRPFTALIGFRSADLAFGDEVFQRLGGRVLLTTDDGTRGNAGLVTDHLAPLLEGEISRVYLCGPLPMLSVALPRVRRAGLPGEVSLEERMGCGFGVCFSCVVDVVRNGVAEKMRVCTEGPVFPIEEVLLGHES
jgi:dihydroorotate dehydrogenase electron transfer subunit